MATECTRDAIQSFLAERGGRVPHADLTHHFRRAFPEDDPPLRTALRETFKTHVDAVACVRVEDGVRLVCLKKRYMRLADPRVAVGNGAGTTRAEPADRRARRDGDGDRETSPSVRALRSMSQRNASFRSARRGDADSDAASLASSNADTDTDDGSSSVAALDPLEHEWMMCASDGEWERLVAMLTGEPSLVLRKDFVTGFNLLHWAAKRGDPELLALAVNFAKRRGVPVDINTRSSCGYTPLHLAAMHGHLEVVKLLVGAYDADVEVRDYGGQKAAQYLANGAALDIRDIIGAFDDGGEEDAVDGREEGARWSFLPHLRPLRMPGEGETGARARVKPLRRMSSLGRVKPRLQKLRDRTSQIVHSASFRELGECLTIPKKTLECQAK
uniref:SOWAHA-C winged helix-turn-helix domain-containing protein n=1 Tax=Gadus morhua TaxID=8049 RepID=A0A8C4YYV2_GADMO